MTKSSSPRMSMIESLERRQLFAITIAKTLAPISVPAGAAQKSIPLSGLFVTDNINGPVVRFTTELGSTIKTIDVELFSKPLSTTTGTGTNAVTSTRTAAVETVNNFLKYVDAGDYNNSLFHRAANFSGTGGTDVTTSPATTLYAGQFTTTGLSGELTTIASRGGISSEFSTDRSNTRGTIAMYRASSSDKATSSFFFNTSDNSSLFDTTSKFTVFGRVLGTGTSVLDTYASLPRSDLNFNVTSTGTRTLTSVPQSNTTAGTADANLLQLTSVARVSEPLKSFSYVASSSNSAVVSTSITSTGSLVLTYVKAGTSTITLTATDLTGATQRTTFAVTVKPPVAALSFNGKTVTDNTIPAINLGATFQNQVTTRTIKITNTGSGQLNLGTPTLPEGYTLFSPLPTTLASKKSTFLTVNIDSSVAITRTGTISIPTDGILDGTFNFPVSLTVSNTLTLGPTSAQGIKSLTYTDADGTKTLLSLSAGSSTDALATLTFNGTGLSVSTNSSGLATVTGNSIGLTSIDLSNTGPTSTFSATPTGGDKSATLGSLTSSSPLKSVTLKNINVVSNLTFSAGLSNLTTGNLSNVTLLVASSLKTLTASDIADSNLTITGALDRATIRTLTSSTLRVGTTATAPSIAADFSQTSQLTAFTLTAPKTVDAFLSSTIFARAIGSIATGTLNPNEGTPASIIKTFAIDRLTGRAPTGKSFSINRIGIDIADSDPILAALGIPTTRLDVSVL